MKKIDSKEFELLAGTNAMVELIRNRIVITLSDDTEDSLINSIYDCAQRISTEMYYVRKLSDRQIIFYFLSPIDRSKFDDAVNQNI